MNPSAIQRLCQLISILPHARCHAGMTARALSRRLRGQGFDVCKRTVQRDLEFLERAFPVERSRAQGDGDRWKLAKKLEIQRFLRPMPEPDVPLDPCEDDCQTSSADEASNTSAERDGEIIFHGPSDLEWS